MIEGQGHDDFCPLIQDTCRGDCVWSDHRYEIDEEGITHHIYCAVNSIYALLLGAFANKGFM